MSEQNIEIVRRIYDLFDQSVRLVRAGRFEEWDAMPEWALYDPEVVLVDVAEIPGSDTYRGIDGLKRWFRAGTETFEEVRWERRNFTARGPHVLVDVHGHFRGAGSGAEVKMDLTHVFTLRDGRVVRIAGFVDRTKALEAISQPE
jgi:ketosteroid isomerase-like protein